MTMGHLFRLYESRTAKFIGEYNTREKAEAVAADTVARTVINDVRYRIEDYPPYNSRPAPLLKHPIDTDAPRDPSYWRDPARGLHPEDHQQAYRNLFPVAIIPMLPFTLLVIGFLILYFLASHGLL